MKELAYGSLFIAFNEKWRNGLFIACIIGQLLVSGPGQCQCSQGTSDNCSTIAPNNTDLAEVCQGSTSYGCAYCEWNPPYENYPGSCGPTASSSNCPPGVNGVSCQDSMSKARPKAKNS